MSLKLKYFWKKIKKSGLALILGISLLTGVGIGVASTTRVTPRDSITLILSTRSNPFFVDIENAVKQKMKNTNYDLNILDSENDDSKQTQNINNAISLGSKAILINVVNSSTAWDGGLKTAYDRKIPIIAIDRAIETKENNGIAQTIASNNVAGARDIAEWFKNNYSNSNILNVFHLGGIQGAQAANDRSKGFKEGFGKDYLLTEIADFKRSEAIAKTNIVLQSRGQEFKVIFADNDEMAIGAIESIKQRKYESITTNPIDLSPNKYYVLGFDGTKEALSLIKEGQMVATVIQQPKLMGEIAVESILKIFNGENISKTQDAETVVVHKGNVDKYL